jgi:hypothetical protein
MELAKISSPACAGLWAVLAFASPCMGAPTVPNAIAGEAASSQDIGGPTVMRRLTQEQYRNIMQDIFGSSVTVAGRFEPDPRAEHLIAVGSSTASVTAAGLEEYSRMAEGIAAQVVDGQLIPCTPASATSADDICARQFLGKVGRLLFRRSLTKAELTDYVAASALATAKVKDFYKGLGLSLAGMLESPQFLYRQEQVEPDPSRPGTSRLEPHSMASRISFLLWNTSPDTALLDAADRGELRSAPGLQRQVDRLLDSPRLEDGVRAFFEDMLAFDTFDALDKDGQLYPNYNRFVARDAQEQTLRTIVDLLLKNDGDYRDLFTTRKTFLTPRLGSIYRVPVKTQTGLPDEWVAYEVPADSPQAGILTQASFLALHSNPGRTSPTARGKALREILLCQKVPDPPGNVNFDAFNAAQKADAQGKPEVATQRQRLGLHASEPMCAGCHKITDPVGLALENYDTVGAFRITENFVAIDASGQLDGLKYSDATGLGKAVHDNPQTPGCLVNRVYSEGVGRVPTATEKQWLKDSLQVQFAQDGYRIPKLLRAITLSSSFYTITNSTG